MLELVSPLLGQLLRRLWHILTSGTICGGSGNFRLGPLQQDEILDEISRTSDASVTSPRLICSINCIKLEFFNYEKD